MTGTLAIMRRCTGIGSRLFAPRTFFTSRTLAACAADGTPMPNLSATNNSPTFSAYFLEAELLLMSAHAIATTTPWVIAPEFPAVAASAISDHLAAVRALRLANAKDRMAIPDDYVSQLDDLSYATMATLFNFHCATFAPVHRSFTPLEVEYIRTVFRLWARDQYQWGGWGEKSSWGTHYKFSPCAYSHRFKNNTLNSTRLAFGVSSTTPPPEIVQRGREVMLSHGLLDAVRLLDGPPGQMFFHGIGWDVHAKAIRTYVVSPDVTALPEEMARKVPFLVPQAEWPADWDRKRGAFRLRLEDVRPQCMVSFAYKRQRDGSYLKVEDKVYVYPTAAAAPLFPHLPADGVQDLAVMYSSDRGVVEQVDVSHHDHYPYPPLHDWRGKLNAVGQRIYDQYAEVGLQLDTIGYTSPDHYTLYYPMS